LKKKAKNEKVASPSTDKQLRDHIISLLEGGSAHVTFDDAVKSMPEKLRGVKPKGLPHSAWMLLEHLRIAQWDILEFCRNARYKARKWPDEYWPAEEAPPNDRAWDKSIQQFRKDAKTMQELVGNSKTDLFAKISWGEGQTILREALLVADHNAYHIAQLVDVRRLLGAWKS
jgi:hypothetical protein